MKGWLEALPAQLLQKRPFLSFLYAYVMLDQGKVVAAEQAAENCQSHIQDEAAGTLAPLGSAGPTVRRDLAEALGLGGSLGVWHSKRDTLVEFAGWLSLMTGSLGKIAQ